MFDGVLDEIVNALDCEDFSAAREFSPELFQGLSKPLVCVGLKSLAQSSPGCGDYLGTEEINGEEKELYGYRTDACIALDIFSSAAGQITPVIDALGLALNALPSGVKRKVISAGETCWDDEAELFRCRCELSCQAFLIRAGETDSGEFTDFYLKGVFNKHEC